MRKKSHLLLSRYLISQMGEDLPVYKKASFYMGSILPDCMPAFLIKPHTFEKSFELVHHKLDQLENRDSFGYRSSCACLLNLGQVTHYLADYFTYPHNACYRGNVMDHCYYEKELKSALRRYLKELEDGESLSYSKPQSTREFLIHIYELHHEYLEQAADGCEHDCEYIARICLEVFQALPILDCCAERETAVA